MPKLRVFAALVLISIILLALGVASLTDSSVRTTWSKPDPATENQQITSGGI
jgi:hypothetical protein